MARTSAHQPSGRLAVRAGRAFDGQASIPGGALVLCADGRIMGVESGRAAAPDGWPVAEYPAGTVLPEAWVTVAVMVTVAPVVLAGSLTVKNRAVATVEAGVDW